MSLTSLLRFLGLGLVVMLACANAVAASAVLTQTEQKNVLLMKNGAVILAHTGQYDKEFPVNAMIEGNLQNYWASGKPGPKGWYPQSFVIELERPIALAKLVVDNRETDEQAYPGVSARQVRFSASTQSSQSDWESVAMVEARQFSRKEEVLDKPVLARWLKVEVLSNYGHKKYMEVNELEAYGKPVGALPSFTDPNGIYQTNYGPLKLQVEGNQVTGCYEDDKGYVFGTTNGRVFDIEWIEHKGEERGAALLVLSSEGFLNGLWYEDGIMKGPWFGNKLDATQKIECDPVTAAMGVGFKADTFVNK